jgi:hypothetical protein
MARASRTVAAAVAFAVGLLAGVASAAPLLAPGRGRAVIPGVAAVEPLSLDRAALGVLRGRGATELHGFPLAHGARADLVLERFEPFAPDARAEVVEAGGARALPLPDQAYFRGRVAGAADSRVLLIAGRRTVHGFVAADGDVHVFGPDARGNHRVYALRDVDPLAFRAPGDFCANDLVPEAVAIPGAAETSVAGTMPATADATATLKRADLAIETDQELRAKFPSDAAALEYVASLAAAATAIYERDVAVRLRVSYLRLWGASAADPWTASSTGSALGELRSYWNNPANGMAAIAGPRTVVHFVSGKPVQGGVAYVNVLCNGTFGYAVSQVYGRFDLSSPYNIWDVMVFTHELGHNFGSPHSHCYSPPLDRCYNGEGGCYTGQVVPSHGTIMSYCHLLAGGLSNIDLFFGSAVSGRIGESVAAASCLATVASSTTTTSRPPTTSTTSTTTTTRPPTTTTTTSTTRPPTTTTSTTTSTTRPPTTTTTTTSSTTTTTSAAPSTTTTTLAPGDADGDGVLDAVDACPGTPAGDLVDTRGCSLCPCDGRWGSRSAYVQCVRTQGRTLVAAGVLSSEELRAAVSAARRASCGVASTTRCCVVRSGGGRARCRVLDSDACALRAAAGLGLDVGPGSCTRARCGR